jgi:hypothetical protein
VKLVLNYGGNGESNLARDRFQWLFLFVFLFVAPFLHSIFFLLSFLPLLFPFIFNCLLFFIYSFAFHVRTVSVDKIIQRRIIR